MNTLVGLGAISSFTVSSLAAFIPKLVKLENLCFQQYEIGTLSFIDISTYYFSLNIVMFSLDIPGGQDLLLTEPKINLLIIGLIYSFSASRTPLELKTSNSLLAIASTFSCSLSNSFLL